MVFAQINKFAKESEYQNDLEKRNAAILDSSGVRLVEVIANDAAHSLNVWR